jgi:hypothetical protein
MTLVVLLKELPRHILNALPTSQTAQKNERRRGVARPAIGQILLSLYHRGCVATAKKAAGGSKGGTRGGYFGAKCLSDRLCGA